MFRAAVLSIVLAAPLASAAGWIQESNRHARTSLEVTARYNPESAASSKRSSGASTS